MEKIWGYVVGATIFGSVTGFIVLIIKNLLKKAEDEQKHKGKIKLIKDMHTCFG